MRALVLMERGFSSTGSLIYREQTTHILWTSEVKALKFNERNTQYEENLLELVLQHIFKAKVFILSKTTVNI